MKKHFLKSFALIAMLFCAFSMSAKQYCQEPLTLSGGAEILLSCELVSDGQYRITVEGENLQGFGGSFYNPGAKDLRDAITSKTDTKIVCDIVAASAPTFYTPLYVLCPGEQNIGWPTDIDWTGTCGEGDDDTPATPTEVYDVNFALTSNGSSAEATSGTAAAAIDNNTGSRWESKAEDPQTWTLDLGQARIFNTIEIVWEGAYAKTFTVSVSNDKEDWTPIWTVEGQALSGFPNTQTQLIDKTTARYIQFQGTERGTQYGYSFWEFRVYLAGISTLTTLEAKPANTLAKVGEGLAITVTPKDQNGHVMAEAGEVTYTITPADAGTVVNNVYTPSKIGPASIVASIGEVKAASFEVFGYDGENVALSTSITSSKIVAQSDFAPSGTDAWHAIDGNEGSVWQGSATNGGAGDEESRT